MPPKNPITEFLEKLAEGIGNAADLVEESFEQARRIQDTAQRAQNAPRTRQTARRQRTSTHGRKTSQSSPKSQEPTLYDVLEVSPKASQETISAAFRSLSNRFHPDKATGNSEKMKQIAHAWSVLKDPEKRKGYDRSIGIA